MERREEPGTGSSFFPAVPENYLRKRFEEIMASGDLGQAVRSLSAPDYFYLLRAVDPEEALMLLEAGTPEQWEHLLDLEGWERDRLDLFRIGRWFKLMHRADGAKLARWLLSEGADLAVYYFSKILDIRYVGNEGEVSELPEDFFTIDGALFFRVKEGQDPQVVREILMGLAAEDFAAYRGLLSETAVMLPAEQEETLYRLRNSRLAAFGFFPFDEALEIYSPLEPSVLTGNEEADLAPSSFDEEVDWEWISHFPLAHLEMENLFLATVKGTTDPVLIERWHLEFGGLANQLYCAQPSTRFDPEQMVRVCREAARLIALALDYTLGPHKGDAERLMRHRPLSAFFRVGYGLVLKLKTRAVTWTKGSWFKRLGLPMEFWGDEWGNLLKGLHFRRPKYYDTRNLEEPFRDFQSTVELKESEKKLSYLEAVDRLFAVLSEEAPLSESLLRDSETECGRLLFTFWTRKAMEGKGSFRKLTRTEKVRFYKEYQHLLSDPSAFLGHFQETFTRTAFSRQEKRPEGGEEVLEEALSRIWQGYWEEFKFDLEMGRVGPDYSRPGL